jgi:hypothetical protein
MLIVAQPAKQTRLLHNPKNGDCKRSDKLELSKNATCHAIANDALFSLNIKSYGNSGNFLFPHTRKYCLINLLINQLNLTLDLN